MNSEENKHNGVITEEIRYCSNAWGYNESNDVETLMVVAPALSPVIFVATEGQLYNGLGQQHKVEDILGTSNLEIR